jgi:hypothetical protein
MNLPQFSQIDFFQAKKENILKWAFALYKFKENIQGEFPFTVYWQFFCKGKILKQEQ